MEYWLASFRGVKSREVVNHFTKEIGVRGLPLFQGFDGIPVVECTLRDLVVVEGSPKSSGPR